MSPEEMASKILDELFNQVPQMSRSGQPLRRLNKTLTVDGVSYDIIFIEQNPNKSSRFAVRARNGERIAWGFVNGNYTFRVSDTEGFIIL